MFSNHRWKTVPSYLINISVGSVICPEHDVKSFFTKASEAIIGEVEELNCIAVVENSSRYSSALVKKKKRNQLLSEDSKTRFTKVAYLVCHEVVEPSRSENDSAVEHTSLLNIINCPRSRNRSSNRRIYAVAEANESNRLYTLGIGDNISATVVVV